MNKPVIPIAPTSVQHSGQTAEIGRKRPIIRKLVGAVKQFRSTSRGSLFASTQATIQDQEQTNQAAAAAAPINSKFVDQKKVRRNISFGAEQNKSKRSSSNQEYHSNKDSVPKQPSIQRIIDQNKQQRVNSQNQLKRLDIAPSSARHFNMKTNHSTNGSQQSLHITKRSFDFTTSTKKKSTSQQRGKSGEKLPRIPIEHKVAMFKQRVQKVVLDPMPKCDKLTILSEYEVSEYCQNITKNMLALEHKTQPSGTYMKSQQGMDEGSRAVLSDWLINVHHKLKLLPETLFLTINIVDRYFQKSQVPNDKVQLVGVAALLIATKYEEIYPPSLRDFICISDKQFDRQTIIQMEANILCSLDFDIQMTSSYRFLQRFHKISKSDTITFYLSQYLLELALMDSKMNVYKPSMQAAAALYASMRLQKQGVKVWTPALIEHSNYDSQDLKACARCFFQLASLIQKSNLQSVVTKFRSEKYLEVARIIEQKQEEQQQDRCPQQPKIQQQNYVETQKRPQVSSRCGSASRKLGALVSTRPQLANYNTQQQNTSQQVVALPN